MQRRTFLTSAGLGTAAAMFPGGSQAARRTFSVMQATESRFPAGFCWGTATASYQVEGAATVPGGTAKWPRTSPIMSRPR